jgi:ABC-type uncharacterized transport system substrate-binding protein
MKRREFITLLCGTVIARPRSSRAQQRERMRRIGVLDTQTSDNPVGQARNEALLRGLQQLGWTEGHNLQVTTRWAGGDDERLRKYAAELIELTPDVIVATGTPAVAPLLQATRTVPIVFVNVADPVGAGFVDSLAHPSRNATGFTMFEYSTSAKLLELLKDITPHVRRAAVIRDAALTSGTGQFAAIQSLAPSLAVEVSPINVRVAAEIERAIADFARSSNGGLIVTGSALALVHYQTIISMAARHKLPAIYWIRFFVTRGGLISYGPDLIDQSLRAGVYVDRIFKGEKPADLPVQAPTKYELVINLKTAKALGLTVPDTLLARADEVIE